MNKLLLTLIFGGFVFSAVAPSNAQSLDEKEPDPRPRAEPYLTENQVNALYEKVESDEAVRKTLISEAERGNKYAQNILGLMYSNGRGITQNDAQALAWFQKATEQGVATPHVNLGTLYSEAGKGFAPNDADAAAWLRKAAEQGNAYAQYNLGLMYDQGRGVPKDHALAIAWMRKAADQGHPDAKKYLDLNTK
jgi:TPR repeat protein